MHIFWLILFFVKVRSPMFTSWNWELHVKRKKKEASAALKAFLCTGRLSTVKLACLAFTKRFSHVSMWQKKNLKITAPSRCRLDWRVCSSGGIFLERNMWLTMRWRKAAPYRFHKVFPLDWILQEGAKEKKRSCFHWWLGKPVHICGSVCIGREVSVYCSTVFISA